MGLDVTKTAARETVGEVCTEIMERRTGTLTWVKSRQKETGSSPWLGDGGRISGVTRGRDLVRTEQTSLLICVVCKRWSLICVNLVTLQRFLVL